MIIRLSNVVCFDFARSVCVWFVCSVSLRVRMKKVQGRVIFLGNCFLADTALYIIYIRTYVILFMKIILNLSAKCGRFAQRKFLHCTVGKKWKIVQWIMCVV